MLKPVLDSRKLRYFAYVVENGSFARAAAALNVTQPALSTAIRKLEEELNLPLLDRTVKPIVPTVYGEAVYRSARSFASESVRLQRELHDVADLNTGSVSIVLSATFPYHYVLETHGRIRRQFPNFALAAEMSAYTFGLEAMLRGEYDLIFSQLPRNRTDLRVVHKETLHDRFEVICSRKHPLAALETPPFSNLVEYPWIGGGPFDAFLPGWSQRFLDRGLKPPRPLINTMTIAVTETALRDHNYLTMLPVKCVEQQLHNGTLVALPYPDLRWEQVKGVSWAANRPLAPSVKFFLEVFAQVIAEESARMPMRADADEDRTAPGLAVSGFPDG